jgi:anhydro-N-acetylmuramic acid kinase
LVPPFHQAFFGDPSRPVAVLNIGGISNITLINPQQQAELIGYDCGPGNALMDAWCLAHTGAAFDDAGRWAAQGTVHADLLSHMLAEPFFAKAPPKSTGRDLFNLGWLSAQLSGFDSLMPQDVQATLAELTAQACADCLQGQSTVFESLVVCGGGALNRHLMARLQAALPTCQVSSSAQASLPPLQVEATAFAWLARQTVLRQTSSVASVTGAKGERILGAIYPA